MGRGGFEGLLQAQSLAYYTWVPKPKLGNQGGKFLRITIKEIFAVREVIGLG